MFYTKQNHLHKDIKSGSSHCEGQQFHGLIKEWTNYISSTSQTESMWEKSALNKYELLTLISKTMQHETLLNLAVKLSLAIYRLSMVYWSSYANISCFTQTEHMQCFGANPQKICNLEMPALNYVRNEISATLLAYLLQWAILATLLHVDYNHSRRFYN